MIIMKQIQISLTINLSFMHSSFLRIKKYLSQFFTTLKSTLAEPLGKKQKI